MLLLLDNHDSFTWNLVELLRRVGKDNVNIVIPEKLNISQLEHYGQIIFSPGPGLPEEQPAMFRILEYIEKHAREEHNPIPVLGVCLGMQAIAQYFGGKLFQKKEVIHGQPAKLNIIRSEHAFFRGIGQSTTVGLYHSWAVDRTSLPECLDILAETDDGTIMAITHKYFPICGVQFHPESIITYEGAKMMRNWLRNE